MTRLSFPNELFLSVINNNRKISHSFYVHISHDVRSIDAHQYFGDELTKLHLLWQDNSLNERKQLHGRNGFSSILWFSLIFTGSLIKSKIDSDTMLCLKWPRSRHFLILIVNKQLNWSLRLSSCHQLNSNEHQIKIHGVFPEKNPFSHKVTILTSASNT